jgi:hypothetical protein
MGNIGSHVNITSKRWGHQGKIEDLAERTLGRKRRTRITATKNNFTFYAGEHYAVKRRFLVDLAK